MLTGARHNGSWAISWIEANAVAVSPFENEDILKQEIPNGREQEDLRIGRSRYMSENVGEIMTANQGPGSSRHQDSQP